MDTSIPVTSGSGNNVDVFSIANGNLRQAVVVGDSSVTNNVAPVQSTDPTSATAGLVVRDVNTSAVVSRLGTTLFVSLDPGHLLGSVTANAGTGTMTVVFDPGHELGSIKGSNSSIAVFFDRGNPAVTSNAGTGTFNVQFDPGHTLGNIASLGSITTTVNIFIPDTGHTLGKVDAGAGTFTVAFDPGHTLGTVIANAGTGTMTVAFDPGHTLGTVIATGTAASGSAPSGNPVLIGAVDAIGNAMRTLKGNSAGNVIVDMQSTAAIFTVSGSTSGISVSGVNLLAPSSSYNFKVYAFSVQTTAQVSLNVRFVNGAGGGQTEFWRPLITASGVTGAQGANLAVPPPGHLFATGTNTSLNILLDSASLVHYSVSYIKESA